MKLNTRQRRLSVFDLTGKFIRSVRVALPAATELLIRDHTSAVVAGKFPTPDASGLPLHEVDLITGAVVTSYGTLAPVVRPLSPWLISRAITLGFDGTVWAARRTSYDLELWHPGAGRARHLQRDLNWFRPYVEKKLGTSDPPEPWLMAITALRGRTILVGITIALARRAEGASASR